MHIYIHTYIHTYGYIMGRCTIVTEEKLDHLYVRFCTRAPKPCANFTFAKHKVHNPHIDHELFTRIQFPPTMKSLGKPREGSTWNASNVVWLRPHELNDSDFEPTLFHDGTEAGKPLLIGKFHPCSASKSIYLWDMCCSSSRMHAIRFCVSGDVMQGELGDCYLLGAMSNVSIHPSNIVEQLFVSSEDFNVTGRVVVRFFEVCNNSNSRNSRRIMHG